MEKSTVSLEDLFKRSMKHYVDEIKNRDDYEVRVSEGTCSICKGELKIPELRIYGEKEWKSAYKEKGNECKFCADQRELIKVLDKNKSNLHEQLICRFEDEYWYIPNDLKHAGFKNFTVNVNGNVLEAKKAMDYVRIFAEDDPKKRSNLLIIGNPGTGKTHLATAISRTLKQKGFLVGQLTTGTLLSKIRATYQKGASNSEETIFNDLKKFDLLVLDDLGSEARSKDEFDWSKNKLFEIVNHRIGKATIYTSNFNEKHLPTAIGERVYSRLYNNTKFIELVTEDYRKNFQIK